MSVKRVVASAGDRQLLYAALVGLSLLVVVTCAAQTPAPRSASAPAAAEPRPEPKASSPGEGSASLQGEAVAVDAGSGDAAPAAADAGQLASPLAGFHAALKALKAGTRSNPVRVTWLGDSHTAADFWTDTVRKRLSQRFAPGGPGFVYLGLKPYRHSGFSIELDGEWQRQPLAPASSSPLKDAVLGLGGIRTAPTSSDAKLKLTPRAGVVVGKAKWKLWFRMPDAQSSLRVQLGDKSHIVRGKTPGRVEQLSLEGTGAQSLSLSLRTGRPELLGAVLEGSEPGVVIDTLGINGARVATALAWDEGSFVQMLEQRAPELVVLAYGTNEAGSNTPVERYRSHFAALLKRIRKAAPVASCALFGPTDWVKGERTLPRIREIDQLERSVAKAEGCAYFSVFDAMGGEQSMLRWSKQSPPLGAPDLIHLTPKGYAKIGDDTTDWLLAPL